MSKQFKFSDDFVEKLVGLSKGFFSKNDFEKLLSCFEKEANFNKHFTRSSESNLLRILTSSFDPVSLLNECLLFPHHIEIIIAISANSNYLTDISVRNPEYLYQIFDTQYLDKKLSKESIENELTDGVNRFRSFRAKINYLRSFKRRLTLKIGVSDIIGNSELREVTNNISFLAKGILKCLFTLCYNEIQTKYGISLNKKRYSLCALGKLGGDELNYSSDVDLILFYDKNSKIGNKKEKEFYEILSEATQLFVQTATEITSKGFLYRIDFRLRPDGKHSPLCRTINDYLRYYETRGEDWERQMLRKLSFIDGDEKLYKSFESYLQGFIYPSSFSNSPIEQIKRLRKNIEARIGDKENIKLFKGGIRDIEFSIQALQLINGGRFKDIRTGTTLLAIELLLNKNLIKKEEADLYNTAYVLYRRIEHFLQLMNDTQTHEIPPDGELLEKLSRFVGYKSSKAFKKKLELLRTDVRRTYNSILSTDEGVIDNQKDLLANIKFDNSNAAQKNITYLKSGTGLLEQKEFDSRIINLFGQIEQNLINYLKVSSFPDKILDNLVKVIKSTHFPSIWYSEFTNEKFFKKFLQICEFSQKAIEFLSLDKTLGEFLISRKAFTKEIKEEFPRIKLNQLLFVLSIQFCLKLIKHNELSKILSDYVSFKLDQISQEVNPGYNFFIAGLGSFGSGEMNFSSDVDLIVVAENIKQAPTSQSDFQKFLALAKEQLQSLEVDFRLRPEGKSSPLVWDIKAYSDYLNKRARVWEMQALSKLRFVSGDNKLFSRFKNILTQRIKQLNPNDINSEMTGMFEKTKKKSFSSFQTTFDIKKSKGGLINIEFILQSIILKNPELYKKSLGEDIITKIKAIASQDESFNDLNDLIDSYKCFKELELANQNIFNVKGSLLGEDKVKKQLLADWNGLSDFTQLDRNINKFIKINNSLLQKYL